jgi:RNA polymerase sigma-70 factor (ECF subfamily)
LVVPAQENGDDGALVLAVQQGDVDAFATLFRRHYPAVRRACARRLVDPVEADEVAQAAFVRAFERIHQCAGDRRFGPWVHVIARSLCMDAFRAQARIEPCEEPLAGRREHRPNEPEESVLRRERAAHVHEALGRLPERQRSAVIARDWEELGPGEIADRLGVSVGAVDSLLLRARRGLALSYRRLAGEAGGGATTRPLRAAAAAVGVAMAIGPEALSKGGAAAAAAVQGTASRAAGGVVSAVISVAIGLGATVAPAADPPPEAPPAVTTVAVEAGAPALPARPEAADGRAAPGPGPGPGQAPTSPAAPSSPLAPLAVVPVAAAPDPTTTDPSPPAPPASVVPTTTTVPTGPLPDPATAPLPPPHTGVDPPSTVPATPATTVPAARTSPVVTVEPPTPDPPPVPPVTTPSIPSLPGAAPQP